MAKDVATLSEAKPGFVGMHTISSQVSRVSLRMPSSPPNTRHRGIVRSSSQTLLLSPLIQAETEYVFLFECFEIPVEVCYVRHGNVLGGALCNLDYGFRDAAGPVFWHDEGVHSEAACGPHDITEVLGVGYPVESHKERAGHRRDPVEQAHPGPGKRSFPAPCRYASECP